MPYQYSPLIVILFFAALTAGGLVVAALNTMVAEYGGDVRVEDNADGGATFIIELPSA